MGVLFVAVLDGLPPIRVVLINNVQDLSVVKFETSFGARCLLVLLWVVAEVGPHVCGCLQMGARERVAIFTLKKNPIFSNGSLKGLLNTVFEV